MRLGDVAEQVLGVDEVVARVQVAVVLERDGVAAGLARRCTASGAVPTQEASAASNICTNTVPTSRRTHSSKTAVRNGPHASGSTERSVTSVAFLEAGLVVALDDRDELDEPGAELVAEVAVHLERLILVRGVHGAQHVPVDAVGVQQLAARRTLSNVGLPLLVDAVDVVQRPAARRC